MPPPSLSSASGRRPTEPQSPSLPRTAPPSSSPPPAAPSRCSGATRRPPSRSRCSRRARSSMRLHAWLCARPPPPPRRQTRPWTRPWTRPTRTRRWRRTREARAAASPSWRRSVRGRRFPCLSSRSPRSRLAAPPRSETRASSRALSPSTRPPRRRTSTCSADSATASCSTSRCRLRRTPRRCSARPRLSRSRRSRSRSWRTPPTTVSRSCFAAPSGQRWCTPPQASCSSRRSTCPELTSSLPSRVTPSRAASPPPTRSRCCLATCCRPRGAREAARTAGRRCPPTGSASSRAASPLCQRGARWRCSRRRASGLCPGGRRRSGTSCACSTTPPLRSWRRRTCYRTRRASPSSCRCSARRRRPRVPPAAAWAGSAAAAEAATSWLALRTSCPTSRSQPLAASSSSSCRRARSSCGTRRRCAVPSTRSPSCRLACCSPA
mmetsp:Transcript_18154/g.59848  ORF Transcript_18154/g.59848 Transcript_18154/m.59848 type:complete len:437 (-) Transcript_18154:1496-2806(-)